MNLRHAPAPVHWPLERPLHLAALLGVLWPLGVALFAGWLWQLPLSRDVRWGLWLAAAALQGALLWRGWRGVCTGMLRWDGERWTLQADRQASRVVWLRVWVDGQRWLWMQAMPGDGPQDGPGPARCLLAARDQCPGQWPRLRRAVYSRPPRAAVPGSTA